VQRFQTDFMDWGSGSLKVNRLLPKTWFNIYRLVRMIRKNWGGKYCWMHISIKILYCWEGGQWVGVHGAKKHGEYVQGKIRHFITFLKMTWCFISGDSGILWRKLKWNDALNCILGVQSRFRPFHSITEKLKYGVFTSPERSSVTFRLSKKKIFSAWGIILNEGLLWYLYLHERLGKFQVNSLRYCVNYC
jgi:hypothetical protein